LPGDVSSRTIPFAPSATIASVNRLHARSYPKDASRRVVAVVVQADAIPQIVVLLRPPARDRHLATKSRTALGEARGLPIHRNFHAQRASMHAYRSQLKAWCHERSIPPAQQTPPVHFASQS
jgi:hypothetical protein